MPDLLIELFSEEIPARMQSRAADDLRRLVTEGLVDAGITYGGAKAFSTPRRLTLAVSDMLAESPAVREERKGPREDAPEKALEGFLRSTGLSKDDLQLRDDKKGKAWFATIEKPGRTAAEIVAETLERTVCSFPWPKSMRWGAGSLRWVRPLHRILALITDDSGAQIVPLEIDGIAAEDVTEGHRFMAPGEIRVTGFEDYQAKLRRASVLLDHAERADHIWADATNQAFALGLEVVEDKKLLQEVAGLVEFPVVLIGEIGEEFLELPPEVLQTSMREHQKFFSVRDPKSGRIVRFVTVANMDTSDGGATILAGNRKVLSARLSDAKFFWENDLRIARAGMTPWLEALGNVTFHNRLGSQGERIARVAALSRDIAGAVGADPDATEQAARLCKADLSSEMVYEFPELQGVMGRHYVEAAGHSAAIAAVAENHYAPLGPSDVVPDAPISVAVALADKLDMLTGFWAIDEKPTGSKDPFALRRAALGVIRIILQNDLTVPLSRFVEQMMLKHEIEDNLDESDEKQRFLRDKMMDEVARHGVFGAAWQAVVDAMAGEDAVFEVEEGTWLDRVRSTVPATSSDLLGFLHDRLKVHLRDEGIRHDVIDACLAMPSADDLNLLVKRAEALAAFLKTDDGENLLQGYKRAANILTQAEEKDGVEYSFGADVKFAEAAEEVALFAALDTAEAAIDPALGEQDFAGAMSAMAALRAPIDAFFEAVQVNADNEILRRNRLNMLSRIRTVCTSVADLSNIEG